MIQTSKKSIFALLLVATVLLSVLAMPTLASGIEATPMETVTVELFSAEGELIATFSSQEELAAYMNGGISPMYVTCGTGLYQHGQFTYTDEYPVTLTTDDGFGNITILNLLYVEVRCSSCDGLIKYYYTDP